MVEADTAALHRGGYCGLQGAQWQGHEGQPANCTITIQQKMKFTQSDVVQWGKIVGGGNQGISTQQAASNILTCQNAVFKSTFRANASPCPPLVQEQESSLPASHLQPAPAVEQHRYHPQYRNLCSGGTQCTVCCIPAPHTRHIFSTAPCLKIISN